MKTGVILCGHGSRSQSAVDEFAALADRPPPHPAGADVRSRTPDWQSVIRARPRPLHRFGSQPIEPPALK